MSRTISPWVGKLLNQEEWEKSDKPRMWVLEDELDNYHLYADYAYGGLALTGPRRGIIDTDKSFVHNIDYTIIGLGPYHLNDKCKLFCSSDYLINDRERRNSK